MEWTTYGGLTQSLRASLIVSGFACNVSFRYYIKFSQIYHLNSRELRCLEEEGRKVVSAKGSQYINDPGSRKETEILKQAELNAILL